MKPIHRFSGASPFRWERDRPQIEAAVAQAESKSSGEIVPMIVGRSSDYRSVEPLLFLIFSNFSFFVGFIVAVLLRFSTAVTVIPFNTLTLSLLLLGILSVNALWLFCITQSFSFKKCFLSQKRLREAVEKRAREAFYAHGINQTHDHTGILIFISLFEKKVVIIADKGINDRVKSSYWDDRVSGIIDGIRSGRAAEALIHEITEIGNELALFFPIADDDTDELTNIIVEE